MVGSLKTSILEKRESLGRREGWPVNHHRNKHSPEGSIFNKNWVTSEINRIVRHFEIKSVPKTCNIILVNTGLFLGYTCTSGAFHLNILGGTEWGLEERFRSGTPFLPMTSQTGQPHAGPILTPISRCLQHELQC